MSSYQTQRNARSTTNMGSSSFCEVVLRHLHPDQVVLDLEACPLKAEVFRAAFRAWEVEDDHFTSLRMEEVGGSILAIPRTFSPNSFEVVVLEWATMMISSLALGVVDAQVDSDGHPALEILATVLLHANRPQKLPQLNDRFP